MTHDNPAWRQHDYERHHRDRQGRDDIPWPSCDYCLERAVEFHDLNGLARHVPRTARDRVQELREARAALNNPGAVA